MCSKLSFETQVSYMNQMDHLLKEKEEFSRYASLCIFPALIAVCSDYS